MEKGGIRSIRRAIGRERFESADAREIRPLTTEDAAGHRVLLNFEDFRTPGRASNNAERASSPAGEPRGGEGAVLRSHRNVVTGYARFPRGSNRALPEI